MATNIVDALVLELGIDATKFDEGQEKALQKLHGFERRAQQVAGRATDDFGEKVSRFFRFVADPAREARKHLESLAAPAAEAEGAVAGVSVAMRRTGVAGEAAANTSAVAIRGLAIAGLGAVAVFEGLKKALEAVGSATQKAFGAGVGAAAAGLPVREFSAVGQALARTGLGGEQAGEEWLAQFNQMQQSAQLGLGVDTNMLRALAIAGVRGNPLAMSGEDVMRQLAAHFAGERPDRAIAEGKAAGMPAELVLQLRKLGEGFTAAVASAAKETAIRKSQFEEATKLQAAEARLGQTYGQIEQKIVTGLDPALIGFLDLLTKIGQASLDASGSLWRFLYRLADIGKIEGDILTGRWGEIGKDLKKLWEGAPPVPQPKGGAAGGGAPAGMTGPATPAEMRTLNLIEQRESGGNFAAQNPASSASGAYGIIDSTWAMAAAATGQGRQYQHAKDAPPAVQTANALWILRTYEPNASQSWQASGATLGKPYPSPYVYSPPATGSPAAYVVPPGVAPLLAPNYIIGPAGAAAGATNNNQRTVNASFGPTNINVQGGNPQAIAAAFNDAVQRNLLLSQQNTGLA